MLDNPGPDNRGSTVHSVTLLCTFIGSSNLDLVSFAVECEIKIHYYSMFNYT